MSSHAPGVGSDIESQCGKCKRETWHVILAMMGDDIVRVQCKVCDSQHRFRPKGQDTPVRYQASGARSQGAAARAKGAAPPTRPRAVQEPAVQADPSRPIQRYRADAVLQVADRVEHPQFGLGVVELLEPGKVTIFFPSGRKILARTRAEPQLARRRPVPGEAEEGSESEERDEAGPSQTTGPT